MEVRNTSHNIERVELACVAQSILLAQRLPDAPVLVSWIERSLATRWWEPDSMRRRSEEVLRAAGLPGWLARALIRLNVAGG